MRLNELQARAWVAAWSRRFPCECVTCTIARGPRVQVFAWPFPDQGMAWWNTWTMYTRAAKGGYA